MALLNEATLVVPTAQGSTATVTGTVAAFRDADGWWATLVAPAESVPSRAEVVGQRAQITAQPSAAWARVTDCVTLLATTPTVQLVLRGEGEAPF